MDELTTHWSELEHVVGDKVFVLNEDYRNTLQITEYCNREFRAEIFPIGIKGEEVYQMNLNNAIQWLSDMKKSNLKARVALIVKKDSNSLRSANQPIISKGDVSWFSVNDSKISVLTVENAKGLEFETVAVFCKGMTINELYIAYTRALDSLCVVREC